MFCERIDSLERRVLTTTTHCENTASGRRCASVSLENNISLTVNIFKSGLQTLDESVICVQIDVFVDANELRNQEHGKSGIWYSIV